MYLMPYFLYTPNVQREIIYEMINQDQHVMLRVVFTASVFLPVIYIAAPLVRIVLQLKKGNPAEQKIVLLLSSLIIWVITGIMGIAFTIVLSLPALKIINLFISLVILCFYLLSQRYPYLVQYGTIHVGNESYSKSYLNGLDLDSLGKQLTAMMEQEKVYCDEELSLPAAQRVPGGDPAPALAVPQPAL